MSSKGTVSYTHLDVYKRQEGGNPTTERQRRKIYALTEALGWNSDKRRIEGFVKRMTGIDLSLIHI